MKRIKIIGKTQSLIRDTGQAQPLVDPLLVAETLGADKIGNVPDTGSPPSFAALRYELSQRLLSTGGRPALKDTSRRQKIPLGDDDWTRLCELAQRVADMDARPSPAQVASAPLHLALTNLDAAEALIRGRPIADEHWVQREAPRGEALLRFVERMKHVQLIQDVVQIEEIDCARWVSSCAPNWESRLEVLS
jgi:hypothetical protein